MASEPGHPFFLFMLIWVRDKLREGMPDDIMIEDVTGPGALFYGLKTFEKPEFHGSALEKTFLEKTWTFLNYTGCGPPFRLAMRL
jgi:hypothetical protein